MNKKIFTVCLILALSLALIGLSSCTENAADKLREVNTALGKDYAHVDINVKTSTDEVDLEAKYFITKSNGMTEISYEVEHLNGFDADGNPPSEFISTVKGTATFNGNAITSIDGDQEMVYFDLVDTNMVFRTSYLGEIKITKDGLSARVTNPKDFLQNNDFEGTAMTVSVRMSDSYLTSIRIGYELDGAEVVVDYAFTR